MVVIKEVDGVEINIEGVKRDNDASAIIGTLVGGAVFVAILVMPPTGSPFIASLVFAVILGWMCFGVSLIFSEVFLPKKHMYCISSKYGKRFVPRSLMPDVNAIRDAIEELEAEIRLKRADERVLEELAQRVK